MWDVKNSQERNEKGGTCDITEQRDFALAGFCLRCLNVTSSFDFSAGDYIKELQALGTRLKEAEPVIGYVLCIQVLRGGQSQARSK